MKIFCSCSCVLTIADWYVNHQNHIQGMGLVSINRLKEFIL